MLFIQLFAPALALVLGVGVLGFLGARLRPLTARAGADPRWSWLRVLLTPSGHAFVLPRLEAAPGAAGARPPRE
jgi:hypothetical protein